MFLPFLFLHVICTSGTAQRVKYYSSTAVCVALPDLISQTKILVSFPSRDNIRGRRKRLLARGLS